MKFFSCQLLLIILSIMLTMSCSATNPQNSAQYAASNAVITMNKTVTNQTINFGRNTTISFQGGRFKNCHLQGNNTSITVTDDGVAFENCTFSGTFINSQLKATNFGCNPDMQSVPYIWKSKNGDKVKTKIRQGTNNKKSLESIAQFCTRSKNVSIEFNGAFFTPVIDNIPGKSEGTSNYLTIKNAERLSLQGGTLIQGFYFYNCSDLHVYGINFVGLHEVHDFPTIYSSAASLTDVKNSYYSAAKAQGLTINNTANITADQYVRLGLAGTSTIRLISEKGGKSKNVQIDNCNFEMRTGGIGMGLSSERSNIQNVAITNCKFSHIYFQPLGFSSVSGVTVDNIQADYCLQPFGLGRWANNVKVKNSKFYNCVYGPKQQLDIKQTKDTTDCFSNMIDNCYIQINDRLNYVDTEHYVLLVGQAGPNAAFTVKNSVFDLKSNKRSQGVLCRAAALILENVTINLECSSNAEKSDVPRIFNTGAKLLLSANYKPHIILNNVVVNTKNTRIGYIASPAGPAFDLSMNDSKIIGNCICTYPAFSGLNKLAMSNVNVGVRCQSTFIEKVPSVSLNSVKCLNIGNMCYNSAGLSDALFVNIQNSELASKGRFLNLYDTQSANVNILGCKINCSTFVRLTKDPRSMSMNISGNVVMATANEVFTGVEKATQSFAPGKVKINGNQFSSSASASLYNRNANSNVRKVFSNNTLMGKLRLP